MRFWWVFLKDHMWTMGSDGISRPQTPVRNFLILPVNLRIHGFRKQAGKLYEMEKTPGKFYMIRDPYVSPTSIMLYTEKSVWIYLARLLRVADRIVFRVQNGYYRCLSWIALLGFMAVEEGEMPSLRKVRITGLRSRWAKMQDARDYRLRDLKERLVGKAK